MNDLICLAIFLGSWWLIVAVLRDLGFQWRTLFLLAFAWSVSGATIWLIAARP